MRTSSFMLAALGVVVAANAIADSQSVPLDPGAWQSPNGAYTFEEHAGRRALRVDNGDATPMDVTFEDGVIEFDLAIENTRGFAGIIFRRPNTRDGENFYFRSHQSGNPDANQYTPMFNGQSAWQIYYGPQFAAPTEYRHGEWMQVTLIVKGGEAEVRLDGKPILRFELLREPEEGKISLWTNIAPAWFSNITVSTETIPFALPPPVAPTLPPGAVEQWQVSEEIPWSTVARADRLDSAWLKTLHWQPLDVERNGIANLARVADRARGAAVLARVEVPAANAAEFRFGFSDAVRAYVDGQLVYAGDDTYGSRDYRHLGTVGLYDTLYTKVNDEPVMFTFAVREQFGGWAVAGATPLAVPPQTVVDTLDSDLGRSLHQMLLDYQRDGFSGAVVAAAGGRLVLEAGYGLADRNDRTPFTAHTLAQIGSITKTFTAAAIIDLASRGKLKYHAPVGQYLPGLAEPAREATLHQLLTHSSGMPEYCGDDFEAATLDKLLQDCMTQPLRFAPGEQVAYSNAGYSVLAAVVEQVSGLDLETYLRQRILDPNKLETIGYTPPGEAAPAHGYLNDEDRGVISDRIASLDGAFWNLKGNGGMQASAKDMFGWYEALAGRRMLNPEIASMALKPQVPTGENAANSYGWGVGADEQGDIDRLSFAGSDGVFFSYFWWNPQKDRFFYLVGNSGEQETIEVVRAVRDRMRD